ncbi:MAG TPA: hypothetical protein VGN26_09490 [Armatimonadota bacterium]
MLPLRYLKTGALVRHPWEGRRLTEDPIGYDGGVNLYGYCEGDF